MKAYKNYMSKKIQVVEEKLNGFKDVINSNNRFGVR
jgi:hypothetical protein